MSTCPQCGNPISGDSPGQVCTLCSSAAQVPQQPQSDNTATTVAAHPAGEAVSVPKQCGPIDLVRMIGRGGMGEVWLGRHKLLKRDVAVKLLLGSVRQENDPAFATFIAGARVAAYMEHPGLNKVYDADVVDGVPYLVLELLDGPNLAKLVESGPLKLSVARAVLEAAGGAIAELGQNNLVHRDIKPSNIILTADGRVIVTDFGLACAGPSADSVHHAVAGTPAYMAPEMFDGTASIKTDIYAFGMTAYHLLAGKTAFAGDFEQQRRQHREVEFDVEPLVKAKVPLEAIDVIQRATSKNPLFRPKTMWHVLSSLGAAFDHAKISPATREELTKLAKERMEAGIAPGQSSPTPPPSSGGFSQTVSDMAQRKRERRGGSSTASAAPPLELPPWQPPAPQQSPPPQPSSSIQAPRRELLPEPRFCGNCGYCIAIADTITCPECGSDLRVVGLLERKRKRFWAATAYLAGWSVASFLVAALISMGLEKWVFPYTHPYAHDQHLERTITTWRHEQSSSPGSDKWTEDVMTIKQDGHKMLWGRHVHLVPPVTEMTIEDAQTNIHSPLHVNLQTLGYHFGDSAPALLQWMAAQGWNPADPANSKTADAILKCAGEMSPTQTEETKIDVGGPYPVRALPTTWSIADGEDYSRLIDGKPFRTKLYSENALLVPLFHTGNGGMGGTSTGTGSLRLEEVGLFVVWLAGIWWIIRRRPWVRRRVARAARRG